MQSTIVALYFIFDVLLVCLVNIAQYQRLLAFASCKTFLTLRLVMGRPKRMCSRVSS